MKKYSIMIGYGPVHITRFAGKLIDSDYKTFA
jgi:hypothetical protein